MKAYSQTWFWCLLPMHFTLPVTFYHASQLLVIARAIALKSLCATFAKALAHKTIADLQVWVCRMTVLFLHRTCKSTWASTIHYTSIIMQTSQASTVWCLPVKKNSCVETVPSTADKMFSQTHCRAPLTTWRLAQVSQVLSCFPINITWKFCKWISSTSCTSSNFNDRLQYAA